MNPQGVANPRGLVNPRVGAREIARGAATIMALTLASRLFGFLREQAIAAGFGASAATDAYVAAFSVATLLPQFLTAVISFAFVPVFTPLVASDRERAWRLASSMLNATLLAAGGVAAIGAVFRHAALYAVAGRFPPDTFALAAGLAPLLFAGGVALAAAGALTAVLNGLRRFGAPAAAPVAMSLCVITGALLGARAGVWGLALATALGMAAQAGVQAVALRRAGMRYSPVIAWRDADFRAVWRLGAPVLLGQSVALLVPFVDRHLASGLAPGSIAALNFAAKLVQLPLGLFVLAVSTAIFPELSLEAAQVDRSRMARIVGRGLQMVLVFCLPAATGLALLREPIVRVLFERGEFTPAATAATAGALAFYAFSIIGQAVSAVLAKAFFALRNGTTPVVIGVFTAGLNIGLDWWLVRVLGHEGIALANAIAVTLGAAASFIALRRQVPELRAAFPLRTLLRLSAGTAAMAAVLAGARLIPMGPGLPQTLVGLASAGAAGVVAYAAVILLLRGDELEGLRLLLGRRAAS